MNRRKLLKSLIGFASIGWVANQAKAGAIQKQKKFEEKATKNSASITSVLLHTSPVAGFQYYEGKNVWSRLKVGATLKFKAEPTNKYDKDAIEIYWQDHSSEASYKLGYLPRKQNYSVNQLLQNRQNLYGVITKLKESDDPWQKVEIKVFLDV
ncbi:HIRAN domain-containing protein [Thiomicrorhabdus sp. 6S3-12]|uniref:HIRAN domain-containing protein n=1 Tax=Thiomicrorhabdus sp. 6S3-12 TaxID=2819681 RepID=UPI001AAD0661|nr:HIRAN domain-containing protein [Thiomicrorhabdus sp. 6S3-12]MBO1924812.1 HIRAN domain-containing protein [Thiomicrorhabdus sp. 6S3-12]